MSAEPAPLTAEQDARLVRFAAAVGACLARYTRFPIRLHINPHAYVPILSATIGDVAQAHIGITHIALEHAVSIEGMAEVEAERMWYHQYPLPTPRP